MASKKENQPNPKRKPCTNRKGYNFPSEEVKKVWNKGKSHVWGDDWKLDPFNNLIKRSDYGKVTKRYGWDVDHKKPVAEDGSDKMVNLQPLQAHYNRYYKADNYPWGNKQHEKIKREFEKDLKALKK